MAKELLLLEYEWLIRYLENLWYGANVDQIHWRVGGGEEGDKFLLVGNQRWMWKFWRNCVVHSKDNPPPKKKKFFFFFLKTLY